MMQRTWILLAALVAWPVMAVEPQTLADSVGTDPAQAWTRFLGQAEWEQVYPAYDVLDEVGYRPDGVDAALCRQNAVALKDAVIAAPVSIVLRRAAMLCAEAVGDEAGAERALTALAALSKLALSQASDNVNPKPIRVLRPNDAYALLHVSGLEYRYDYYADVTAKRYFPLMIAAWDPDAKLERHLQFDYIDTIQHLDRKDRFSGFPINRKQYADAFVESQVKGNDILGIDIQAVRDAAGVTATKDKIAKLRPAAERGGIQAALNWLNVCASKPYPGCGDGFVDAVLPQAEKQHALPMTLLAYAYAEGVGVKPDAESARQLLDAADKRWRHDGATLTYTALWSTNHKGVLPDALRQRLVQAQARGSANAELLLIREKFVANPSVTLSSADVAFLSDPKQNGLGMGYSMLADYHATSKHQQEALEWGKRAAEAGNTEAQANYGFALYNGKQGVTADRTAGERMLAEAAQGGDAWSQRYLASLSAEQARWADAEGWLMGAAGNGDIKAILFLAELYEWERPGVSGKVDRAVEIYRSLADEDDVADGRRHLAAMALAGRGMKKDPEQARQWLLADAEKADYESQAMLGSAYLRGEFGKADETEGTRWMERAIQGKEESAFVDYGAWLYYTKQTPTARVRAIELWKAGDAQGFGTASNNLAWALCTASDAVFDAKVGLAAAARIGELENLDTAELDTVAACHAATGNFKRAVELQTRAIELLKKDQETSATANSGEDYTKGYRDRLALYARQQRYVEPSIRK